MKADFPRHWIQNLTITDWFKQITFGFWQETHGIKLKKAVSDGLINDNALKSYIDLKLGTNESSWDFRYLLVSGCEFYYLTGTSF